MISTMTRDFPSDMTRASEFPEMSNLENMAQDALECMKDYARENPATFALCALGIGFVLGWKLKPW